MNGVALCAGAGGLELGLHRAIPGYRTVCYVEWDHRAAATLVSNFGEGLDEAPVWDDLKSFDGAAWRGLVGIVSAGFPCQPFSDAGLKRGHEDERHLWPYVFRVIQECEPEWVFTENVPGIITTHAPDGRPAAVVVREDLECLGYRVEEGLFSAAEVGAPHKRLRWFLVAHADRVRREQRDTAGRRLPIADEGRATLAHAGCQCSQGEARWGRTAGELARNDFPPGPGDDAGWRDYLSRLPGAAPAVPAEPGIRRTAHGLADGLDLCLCSRRARLQQCGNGVVPQTAALAWATLAGNIVTEVNS